MATLFIQSIESLFSKVPAKKWDDIDRELFGDVFYDLDGNRFNRNEQILQSARLPIIFNPHKVMAGDLIPATSFGSSLANLLKPAEWDALRHPIIERNHSVCECCGQQVSVIEVHEVWRYEMVSDKDIKSAPPGVEIFGTQYLDGLLGLCHECHECFHLGLAQMRGRFDVVLDRLCAINGWSIQEGEGYYAALIARHEYLNRHSWALDLSGIQHPSGGFTIQSSWKRDPDDPNAIRRTVRDIESVTIILNAPWRIGNETEWSFTDDSEPAPAFTDEFNGL